MLSFGYGLLFGNVCVAVVGAHLDPDIGFLSRGGAGLVHDLCDPFQPAMIDDPVFSLVREGLPPDAFECSQDRCILSDDWCSLSSRGLHGRSGRMSSIPMYQP